MKQYTYQAFQINESVNQTESNCSGIMFVNQNAFTIFINSFPLLPGSTLVLDTQQSDTMDVSKYKIGWGANVGTLYIWKKQYHL